MDSFPTCQVCQEYFTLKGPVPHLLPCLHAVCETCVTSAAGGVISCAACQNEINLTEEHLQKDVVRQREIFHLTVQHRPSDLLCTHEDDGNQPMCWCQECEEFLCEYCQTLHGSFKATRRHIVQEIADIQPGALDYDQDCIIHRRHFLEFWDKICKVLICARCRLEDHAEHDIQDIDVAAATAKKETATKAEAIQSVAASHSFVLEKSREQLRYTEERSFILKDNISYTLQFLKELLDQREKELTIALDQHTEEAKGQLDMMRKSSESSHMRCKMTTEYIHKALLYASKCDLLSLSKWIEETTQICVASVPPKEQEPLLLPVFCTQDLDKLKTAISSFGEIGKSQVKATSTSSGEPTNAVEVPNQHSQQLQRLGTDLSSNSSGKAKKNYDTQGGITEGEPEAVKLQTATANRSSSDEVRMRRQTEQMTCLLQLGGIHFLYHTATNTSIFVQCSQLKYDIKRVNQSKTQINPGGELVNKAESISSGNNELRFQNYPGTTTTAPFPLTSCLQYLEVLSDVQIGVPLEDYELVLETEIYHEEYGKPTGLYPEAANNSSVRLNCYSLFVAQCPQHDSVCTHIGNHGKVLHHLPNTLPNTSESHTMLHLGILVNTVAKTVIFFDVTLCQLMGVLEDVDCSKPLWPMFGLYAQEKARVTMKIVEGNSIIMTLEKKNMFLKALA